MHANDNALNVAIIYYDCYNYIGIDRLTLLLQSERMARS